MRAPRQEPHQPTPEAAPAEVVPAPVDLSAPQLTLRAVLTGMVLGGTLSLCNIYAGLKVGWGFNMSITAALIAFGFWSAARLAFKGRPFGLLENNVNQTAASAGANISSAGLVSAMPALTMLTGQSLSWAPLALWVFSVSMVGIVVAVGLRRQMILVDKLPFPSGIASAETLKEMYAKGREAMARVGHLAGAAVLAAGLKLAQTLFKLPLLPVPGALRLKGAEGSSMPASASLFNLTFALEPSVLMVGVGGLVGMRVGLSLLLGAAVAWGVVAPRAIELGWAKSGPVEVPWFGPVVPWLLWPGVAMMVSASLTSFAFAWRSVVAALRGVSRRDEAGPQADTGEVSRRWFVGGLLVAALVSTVCQALLFGIHPAIAALAVVLTFALAVVAGRVAGETSITPVGPMGKVTQLIFGVVAPGNPAANLMAANVTGGAASQTGDLLQDLKTGYLLGASARLQAIAQTLGLLAGALVGSAAYLVLVPDPKAQLLTKEWPAPAVAQWKAVAEVFMKGFEAMPPGAVSAIAWGAGIGVVLAVAEKLLPKKAAKLVPSPASIGLAFVIPGWNSVSMFLGALIALLASRFFKSWSARFLVVVAAGLIAGESLMGVGIALQKMLFP